MTDGLDAVREVATHWRRRYQAAQAIIEELQAERDESDEMTVELRGVIFNDSIKWGKELDRLRADRDELADERDDYKLLYENKRDQHKAMLREFWQMSNERNQARRRIAELEATVANLDPRIARLERITGGGVAPIQGVEDMYFTGESWQTEDE